ncbi:unnamed protein product [Chrysoparadoxa australica]
MASRQRKPLPRKLAEDLAVEEGYYRLSSLYKDATVERESRASISRKAALRAEKRVLSGLLDRPRTSEGKAASASKYQSGSVASAAAEVRKLEIAARQMRLEAEETRQLAEKLREQNMIMSEALALGGGEAAMEAKRKENEDLRQQNQEMQSFLADYGLVWVGGEAKKKHRMIEGLQVSHRDLLQKLQQLNELVGSEQGQIVTSKDGRKAQLQQLDHVEVTVWLNGLVVDESSLRPFTDPAVKRFIQDVMDGYFPSEFMKRFPNGFLIRVHDKSTEPGPSARKRSSEGAVTLQAAGSYASTQGMKEQPPSDVDKARFLSRLPASVICNGRVVEVRADVQRRLEGAAPAQEQRVVDTAPRQEGEMTANLQPTQSPLTRWLVPQVRVGDGKRKLLVMLPYRATVGELRASLAQELPHAAEGIKISSAFPARAHADDSRTLQQEELVPTAVLHVTLSQG